MTERLLLQVVPALFVVAKHKAKQKNERDKGYPYCPTLYKIAKNRPYNRSQKEEQKHEKMLSQLDPVPFVEGFTVQYLLCQTYADLADMVCRKGRRHGRSLSLTKGVKLHGGNKIYRYLRELHREGFRDKSQHRHNRYFNSYKHGVPADFKAVLYRFWQKLRYKCPGKIGRNRNKVVNRPFYFAGAKRHPEQNDVSGLGVAKDVAS